MKPPTISKRSNDDVMDLVESINLDGGSVEGGCPKKVALSDMGDRNRPSSDDNPKADIQEVVH